MGCGASSAATPVPPNGLPAAIKPGATPSSPKTSDGGHLTSVQPDAPAGSAKSKAAAQETNTPDGATTQTGETTKDAKTTAGAAGSPSHKSTHPPNGTSLAGAPNSSSQQQQQQQISIASTTVTSKKDEPTQNQKGQDGTQKRDRDAARASHSSKLDMLQEHASGISRDTEAETQEILAKVLVCRNCEDVQLPLAVWCTSCHKDEDESPPVYCEACNTDLHQFAKTKQHVRESLSTIHTTRMKTATELGYPGTLLPPGLPQLESLACSNCDEDPQMYCTQCKTILCTSCAREIHQPKLLAAHTRHLLTSRFIAAGFHAAAKQHDKPVDKPAAISLHRTGSTGDSHSKPKQISVIQSPHALVRRTSAGANGSTASGGAGAKTFMPSSSPPTKARLGGKYRHRSTETTDIVPTENPGLPGDVYVFGDPSVNEPTLGEVQLTFRNISNPFDIIGTGVSIISVACGTDHAGAVTSLGSLFMWGNNHEKQLGCGSALGSERFTKDPILIEFPRHAPIKAVACGSVHTLALTQQGEVYAWGDGKMGKLGQVSDLDCDTPALVTLGHWGARGEEEPEDLSGEEEVVAIACGQNNSGCVVSGRKDRCQLYIWGEGQSGQIPSPDLSRGGSRPSLLPKLFPQLVCIQVPEARSEPYPEIIALGFGTKHVVCITGAGAVFTWGETGFGACGYSVPTSDGDNVALQLTPRLVPKLFLDGVKAKAVACGERHTTILSSTGDVWSFGSGESHQIGIMDNVDQFLPQRAVGLGPSSSNPIKSITVGSSISAAVNEAGETYMWGYGVESPVPALVHGLRGKSSQAICIGSNSNMVFLTGTAQEVWEWQFDGADLDQEEQHGQAAGEVGGGGGGGGHDHPHHDDDDNHSHSHGKGTPVLNPSLRGKRITSMSAGKNHYIVVTADGKMFGWGSNHLHELGVKLPGDISFIPHPLEIKIKSSPTTVQIVDVKCGVEHTIALASNGAVYTWGIGFEGRLGHISNADVLEPKAIQSLLEAKVRAIQIAIGPSNCACVTSEGHAYLWGAGNGGQIGNNDMMPQFKPVLLKALSDANEKVSQIALGNYHAACLTESRKVYTWGDNRYGQLGLFGTFDEDHTALPKPVTALNLLQLAPTKVECGDNVCMVLTKGGELWGWGTGETQQLPTQQAPEDGSAVESDEYASSEDIASPVKLEMPFQKAGGEEPILKVTSFSVRDIHCCCVTEDGRVWRWGWDLGSRPTAVDVKKPVSGSSAASLSTLPGQAPKMEQVRFEKVVLGHTRMLLQTA